MTPFRPRRLSRVRWRRPVALLACSLLFGAIGACSSSDPAGPAGEEAPLEALAGRWEATSMVLTSKNDESISFDIIQDERFSGSFVLTIQVDGRYTATLTVFGQERVERGTLSRSGDALIFNPDGGEPSRVDWTRTGDRLTIDGETTFDFNGDGEDEPADLHQELVRS